MQHHGWDMSILRCPNTIESASCLKLNEGQLQGLGDIGSSTYADGECVQAREQAEF